MKKQFPLALAALIALASLVQAGDDSAGRGAALLGPFKAKLKGALVAGMQEGPANAIEVCREDAPAIAAALSVDGVLMGRSSHRLRNRANAAPEWLVPIIDAYASGEAELVPRVVKVGDDRTGYAEPISVQPLCLTCHGTKLKVDVADRIEALYPDDEATGFSEGDFRGVFWVEF